MKNILIPTDFSACANNAAEIGINLAKKTGAGIHFLHIISTPVDWVKLPKEKEQYFPEIKKAIGFAEAELDKLHRKAEKAGIKVERFLVYNKSSDEIINHAKKYKDDFIVMGSHGSSGIREVFIGSNAQKVVRYSQVPVLVVRDKPKQFDVKNILFVSDFTKRSEKAYDMALTFSDMTNAKMHLLFVNTPGRFEDSVDTRDRMKSFLKKAPKDSTAHIENALEVETGVLQVAQDHKYDLIVMSTEGRKGIRQMLAHSIAEAVVNHATVPVLCINSK